jgi:sensor histidine kinase regulating citrate/malate metabolism
MAEKAIVNLMHTPIRTGVAVSIMVVAFAGMVTSAYTANNIKRSTCDLNEAHIKTAYKWAWTTAVITGFLSAGVAGLLVYTAMKKKKL